MITDCPVWLRRSFLLERDLIPDEPPCTCDDCPPEPTRDDAVLGEGDSNA